MRIDLHTHSSVSDGTDRPEALVRKAADEGLDVIALTDHDTFDGLGEAMDAGRDAGVRVVPGVEISTRHDGRSVHLLGYGCRTDDGPLLAELERIRDGRTHRIPATVERLVALGLPVTLEEVEAQARGASVGRPHVADALVARGHVANRDEAFDVYLSESGPAFVDRYAPDLAHAIDLVHDAGGVAVIAHPWSRGARETLPETTLARLTVEHDLDGIEVDHPDHSGETRKALRDIATRRNLLTTGSSDHHGTGKTRNPLAAETTSPAVLDEIERRIDERGGFRGR